MFKNRELKKRFGHGTIDPSEFGKDVSSKKPRTPQQIRRRWLLFIVGLVVVTQMIITISKKETPIKVVEGPDPLQGPIVNYTSFFHGELIQTTPGAPQFTHLKEIPSKLSALTGLSEGSEVAQNTQLETAQTNNIPLEVENSIEMRFRLIPGGNYMMGSPKDEIGRTPDEGKIANVEMEHPVNIPNFFYAGKFEVTQKQWQKVMGNNPSAYQGPNRPVEEITWNEAVQFCNKLSEMENLPKGTYRMLTEAEWEYCCRAGTYTPYYFASIAEAHLYVDYKDNNGEQTKVVGGKRPNAWGLFNMHGHVMEWCNDYYRSHYNGEKVEGNRLCVRGGNWSTTLINCRSAQRYRMGATSKGNVLGFRIIRSVQREFKQFQKTQKQPQPLENNLPSSQVLEPTDESQ